MTPAEAVRKIGIPECAATQNAFRRFAGLAPCRQSAYNFCYILSQDLEDERCNVYNCSTYAVLQEYLGKLSGSDKDYAGSRGGVWSMQAFAGGVTIISVRDILRVIADAHRPFE